MDKKDKQSIIIASMFLVVLIGCLGFVIYVKMTYDQGLNNVIDEGENRNALALTDIVNSFNSSRLVNDYATNGDTISMTMLTDNAFSVSYVKSDVTGFIEGTYMGPVLSVKLTNDEVQNGVAKEVFKELVNVSCKSNGYLDRECDQTTDKFLNENYVLDGLAYQEITENEKYLRLSTAVKLNLYREPTPFTSDDFVDIRMDNYSISGNDFMMVLNNIGYDDISNTLTVNANINNTLQDNRDVRVVYKIYDINQSELMTQEYTNTDLEDKNNFTSEVSFVFDETIVYDGVNYISVEFITE